MLSDIVSAEELLDMAVAYRADARALRQAGAMVEARDALDVAEQRLMLADVCAGRGPISAN